MCWKATDFPKKNFTKQWPECKALVLKNINLFWSIFMKQKHQESIYSYLYIVFLQSLFFFPNHSCFLMAVKFMTKEKKNIVLSYYRDTVEYEISAYVLHGLMIDWLCLISHKG